ncbi:hypothetical protein [Nannocystis punicea]|uniref:Outer membrane protein beta-barrel domain-containing protein n=1 Tax=Nannocystis punicea TaxID=2995304 RepID=A0ABY7HG36_9BACT|nr:hypothetical protein [Nannocystis poenicansa]WAS98073.1 hypothetical protein O0S08_18190 [Nannocystis poenicansa]
MPLVLAFSAMVSGQAQAGAAPPSCPAEQTTPERTRRLVFANLYGLDWSVLSGARVPSGEVSLFLGGSLRPRLDPRGLAWNTALGYELSASVGGADFFTAFHSWGGEYGLAYHRHHFAALGYGGPHDRLFYNFGGGLLLWRTTPIALEADARLGVVLGVKRGTRVKGILGGQARVIGVLEGRITTQLGFFAGLFVF